ncbi:hypothetical protein D9M72_590400 [compost metagenome]
MLVGPADNRLHLLDGLREGDGQRRRGEMLGPVLAVGIEGIGVGEELAGLYQGLQRFDQGFAGHSGTLKWFMVVLRTAQVATGQGKGRTC